MYQTPNIDFTTLAGNYSLSEIDTGYTWIDGSPIYKKTISYSSGLSAAVETEVPHGVSNISECIKIESFGRGATGNNLMLPAEAVNGAYVSVWTVTSTVIRVSASIPYSDTIYFTIYYTKTSLMV